MNKSLKALFFIQILLFQLCLTLPVQAKDTPHTIVLTNSDVWHPFSYIDPDGEPRGLLIDFWKEFAERNHTKVEFRLTGWSASLKMVKDSQSIVHAGLFKSDERAEYLEFSHPLKLEVDSRLIISKALGKKSLKEMGSTRVAVVKHSYSDAYLRKHYPELVLRPYSNGSDMMEAVLSGYISAFVTDFPAAMYFLHQHGAHDKFIVADLIHRRPFHIAVPKGQHELLKFIETGIDKIPEEELERIVRTWIYSAQSEPAWLHPLVITAFISLLAGFIILYVFFLKRQVARKTAELKKTSQTDPLTGLQNRRRMEEVLNSELDRNNRYDRPFVVILLDIDHFKQINDTFGHATGDEVLVKFAEVLTKTTRKTDHLCRWGGEELMIICPETTQEQGIVLAEKIRVEIETSDFGDVGRCTASFGLTQSLRTDTEASIFNRCDQAMYHSKGNGRNLVTAF